MSASEDTERTRNNALMVDRAIASSREQRLRTLLYLMLVLMFIMVTSVMVSIIYVLATRPEVKYCPRGEYISGFQVSVDGSIDIDCTEFPTGT